MSSHLVSNARLLSFRRTIKKQVGIIEYRIVDDSDPEVVVNQVSDLSSAKESVCFLSLLFLKTDRILEVGILDDLVQE